MNNDTEREEEGWYFALLYVDVGKTEYRERETSKYNAQPIKTGGRKNQKSMEKPKAGSGGDACMKTERGNQP